MKKIIYVTDAVRLNIQHLDFACYLSNLTHSKLTGIFLENQEHEVRSPAAIQAIAVESDAPGISVRQLKEKICTNHIHSFQNACETRGVNCVTHQARGVPLAEVISESRYADLLIIDASISFSGPLESSPTKFVQEVLSRAECPVIVAPEAFEGIDKIIFAYNGTESSVFAMKQFTYLLPELRDRKAIIFDVVPPGKKFGKSQQKLKEWLGNHYDQAEIVLWEDEDVRARLLEYLLGKKNSFVVMGAFGRSLLSGIFSPSHADPIVRILSLPIFITHS